MLVQEVNHKLINNKILSISSNIQTNNLGRLQDKVIHSLKYGLTRIQEVIGNPFNNLKLK